MSKVQIDYNNRKVYSTEDLIAIGATDSTTLRTVTAYTDDNCKHVRKFGKELSITACTDIDEPTANGIIRVYSKTTNTLLGSRANGGAFTAGSTLSTAEGVYLILEADGGAFTTATTESITLTGKGALTVCFAAEALTDGTTRTLYLSDSGSTYYDTGMVYGGARHTPDGTDALPYFDISTALAALGGAFTIVTVLDSEIYSEMITISGAYTLQSSLGETPELRFDIGASYYTARPAVFQNVNSIFFNENGSDDTGDGTWHTPYLTMATAYTNIGSADYLVYGGDGATASGSNFNEALTINDALTISSDNFYILKYRNRISFNGDSTDVIKTYNINFDRLNGYMCILAEAIPGFGNDSKGKPYISNCTFQNSKPYDGAVNFVNYCYVENSYFYNNSIGIYAVNGISDCELEGKNNIFYNNSYGIYAEVYLNTATFILTNNFTNSIFLLNTESGIHLTGSGAGELTSWSGSFYNCTFFNSVDINFASNWTAGAGTTLAENSIFGYTDGGGNAVDGLAPTNTNIVSCAIYNKSIDSNVNNVTPTTEEDQLFISDIAPVNYGLQSISTAITIGALLNIITIINDTASINGFIFNGNKQMINAIKSSAGYTAHNIKYCTIYDFLGIAGIFNNSEASNHIISYCKIYSNGEGLAFYYGGNNISNCLIYNNTWNGIYCNYDSNIINHCVVYSNKYNYYFGANTSILTFKNNISKGASLYGIYSTASIDIIYSNITDSISSTIDISDSTNVNSDPLFVSVETGNENFHLKSIYLGYKISSACIDAADDGYDIGAWIANNSLDVNDWKSYTLTNNPRNINELLTMKGSIKYDDSTGNMHAYGEDQKIILPLEWSGNSATSNEQRLKIRYFQTLYPSRKNNLTESECLFRVKQDTENYYGSGTAVISALTITDSTKTWIENEKKGWHVTIVYESGTLNGNISASGNTLTVSGAGWTTNEHTGYWIFYDKKYFYILSNTSEVLTLSDGNNYLSDATNISWEICKYFKITSNTETALTVTDDDSELPTGSYQYFIDFILCRVRPADFKYQQINYNFNDNDSKTGYGITFEEVDG